MPFQTQKRLKNLMRVNFYLFWTLALTEFPVTPFIKPLQLSEPHLQLKGSICSSKKSA